MIVALDASVLVYLVTENANPPIDPATGQPLRHCKERIEHLIETLQGDEARIVVPTPSLAEVLVRAERAGPEFLRMLGSSRHFRIAAFDERAAVEFAARQTGRGAREGKPIPGSRAKSKFDDQIVAIAAVEGATMIYSDDSDIRKLVESGVQVKGVTELPLPSDKAQMSFPID